MGRVSSRYNYRISKTKKNDGKKAPKKLPPGKIVIRNRKKESTPTVKPRKTTVNAPTVKKREKKANAILKQANRSSSVKKTVTLENIKDYCNGKRVILVGNAKDIIKNPYGPQIDSYDIVIRMNHGHPLGKYTANMGAKYNIWAHGFLSHKKQINEYSKIKKRIDFHIETNENKLCKRIFDNKAFLIPKKWYKTEYEKNHKGKEMSTGLNAATFFVDKIGTMSEVAIVGFDFLKTTNRVLQSAPARKFHDTTAEEVEMLALLERSGKYIPFNEKYNFAK